MTKKMAVGLWFLPPNTWLCSVILWLTSLLFSAGWEVIIPALRLAWPRMDVKCIVLILVWSQLTSWRANACGITACPSPGGTPTQLLLFRSHMPMPESWEVFWMNLGITRWDFFFMWLHHQTVNRLSNWRPLNASQEMQHWYWIVECPVLVVTQRYLWGQNYL